MGYYTLPANLFFGTSIAVNILVLSKHKTDTKIQFIDASEFYKKETNNNVLTNEHIEKILNLFAEKKDVKHIVKMADIDEIKENDYNLSVSAYVEPKDTREKIDIKKLNKEIEETVKKIDVLRAEIDKIVEEIEING